MPKAQAFRSEPTTGSKQQKRNAPANTVSGGQTKGSKVVQNIAPNDDDEEEEEDYEDDEDYGDGEEDEDEDGDNDEDDNDNEDDEQDDEDEDGEFEQQSSDDDSIQSESEDESDEDIGREAKATIDAAEYRPRKPQPTLKSRNAGLEAESSSGMLGVSKFMHTDDLSSDDEEDPQGNTIGRVPLHWYDAYDHIGYNVQGNKVVKSKGRDRIDLMIDRRDDPTSGRTVYDMYNDRKIVLSERDLEIIRRIQAGAFAHPEHDDTPDYVPYFSSEKEAMPIWANPEPKRRFVPSKWELMKVVKIVKAMREGRYKTIDEIKMEKKKEKEGGGLRMIWNEAEDEVLAESRRHQYHLPAPKLPLPGHAESYNPPAEYLLTAEEKEEQEKLSPEDRQHNFIPKTHACLRHVGGYENFVRERFERCLDLYLCPRKLKKRLNIDPETLVPRLPRPRELKPFPNSMALQYLGHKKPVRSLTVSPDGQYLVTGSDDGTVRLWEVDTCLCRHTWQLGRTVVEDGKKIMEGVVMVAWNPNPSHHLLAVAVGSRCVLVSTGTGDADAAEVTEALLASTMATTAAGKTAVSDESDDDADSEDEDESEMKGKRKAVCVWQASNDVIHVRADGFKVGPRACLQFSNSITSISWHYKGDYLSTLCPNDGTKCVAIHQVSKAKTQTPFKKNPGLVQTVAFHPSRPFIFVATQQHVKIFNLVEQKLVKRLITGCKWVSCMAVHPSGDHVVVASYDRRVVWFDLDLSSTPHKTLKFHEKAVRAVQFHGRYPLMSSASDDGTVHIFHTTVYRYVSYLFLVLLWLSPPSPISNRPHSITHYQRFVQESSHRAAQSASRAWCGGRYGGAFNYVSPAPAMGIFCWGRWSG